MDVIIVTGVLLLIGWVVGGVIEKRHFASLAQREASFRLTLTNLKKVPDPQTVASATLVQGQCVVGSDYLKAFASGWKSLVGGELRSFQTMMTRGRREAIARLCEEAEAMGATEIYNLRITTSNIKSQKNKKGGTQVEVLAYATAIVRQG